jgi:hypothetical protein
MKNLVRVDAVLPCDHCDGRAGMQGLFYDLTPFLLRASSALRCWCGKNDFLVSGASHPSKITESAARRKTVLTVCLRLKGEVGYRLVQSTQHAKFVAFDIDFDKEANAEVNDQFVNCSSPYQFSLVELEAAVAIRKTRLVVLEALGPLRAHCVHG